MSYKDSESPHFPDYQECITAVGSVFGAIGTSQQRHLASVGQLWPKNNRNVLKMTAMILACMGVKGDMILNFLHQRLALTIDKSQINSHLLGKLGQMFSRHAQIRLITIVRATL